MTALMLQSWCNLTFLHWRYPVDVVQKLVPGPLAVESFEGSAWVGITPFMLEELRPPWLPPLPWISKFPETNCRTYVHPPGGRSGVWFFSLDAARAPAVAGARLGYGLPYAWSSMEVHSHGNRMIYESARRWPDTRTRTKIEIEPGGPLEADDLTMFLTARFRLYSFIAGRLAYADVEHAPWPLRAARVIAAEQSLTVAAGLPRPQGEPLAHFSAGVRVRIGAPHCAG
jgi:uncharacterized protein YqjF (DUF2071 family)